MYIMVQIHRELEFANTSSCIWVISICMGNESSCYGDSLLTRSKWWEILNTGQLMLPWTVFFGYESCLFGLLLIQLSFLICFLRLLSFKNLKEHSAHHILDSLCQQTLLGYICCLLNNLYKALLPIF